MCAILSVYLYNTLYIAVHCREIKIFTIVNINIFCQESTITTWLVRLKIKLKYTCKYKRVY